MFEEGVFDIVKDNPPLDGLTISQKGSRDGSVYFFSLGRGTDISIEHYLYRKLILILSGEIELYSESGSINLDKIDGIITKENISFGVKAEKESVYMEVDLGRDNMVNEKINAGEIFALKDLIPYRKDSIVNIDVVKNSKMKFVVMAFDEGTGLSEHAAPGDAIIFALEGKGIIGYEGKEYPIKEGENFRFAKNGRHSVRAEGRFKMALLLSLE